MTVRSPLRFEVEKKALRPSGSKSFFKRKAPSIVLPSYSVHSSICSCPDLGIGSKQKAGEGESNRIGVERNTCVAAHLVQSPTIIVHCNERLNGAQVRQSAGHK